MFFFFARQDPSADQLKMLRDEETPLNLDQPEWVQFDKMQKDVEDIKMGKHVSLLIHDPYTWMVSSRFCVEPGGKYKYVLVEGIFVMGHQPLASLFDLTIWVETSEYVCALRRFYRCTQELKGYSPRFVINYCQRNLIQVI